jgi:hypothetical protein
MNVRERMKYGRGIGDSRNEKRIIMHHKFDMQIGYHLKGTQCNFKHS